MPKFLIPLVFPVGIIAVWQLSVTFGIARASVLPPPSQVVSVWFDLVTGLTGEASRYSGTWFDHAVASLWRVLAGFAWSASLGVSCGILIGLSRLMEKAIDPTIQVLRNVPVTAWVPLSLIFFGIGDKPAIFLIGLGAFFPAVLNTTHGVRQVNRTLYKSALMMGASRREMIQRVILPAALPSIMALAHRLSMGIAWVLVVVVEILRCPQWPRIPAERRLSIYRNDVVIAAMFSIGLLGFTSDLVIVYIRNRVVLGWNCSPTGNG